LLDGGTKQEHTELSGHIIQTRSSFRLISANVSYSDKNWHEVCNYTTNFTPKTLWN